MFNIRTIICSSLLLLSSCLAASDFVVGTASAYAPYVSLDDDGNYVGFDIDIAEAVAKKLNRNLVIKDLGSLPSLTMGLKQNKIDAIIWAISITQERQKQMEMIFYQGEKTLSLPLIFWGSIPENVNSLEDLANNPKAVVTVEAGSFQEGFLLTVPNLALKQVDKVIEAILEVKYGKSIATIIDYSLVPKFTAKYPQLKIVDVPLPPAAQSLGNGICINKNNQTLASQVQQAIDELRADGTISQLEAKWNLKGADNG